MKSIVPWTRPATVSFKTVGCRLNQAETAAIRASFEEAGFITVPFGRPCDVCVIHGCVVTARAEEDGLRLARGVQRRCPGALVILAGCAAELAAGAVSGGGAGLCLRRAPGGAAYLAGQGEKFNLPEILGMRFRPAAVKLSGLSPLFDTQRAIVKIQDGCDFRCSYCIVPRVRGPCRSRPAAEIIDEITKLTLRGFPEIILTGVNIGCYADGGCRLPQLLEKTEAVPSLRRFRISSLEITGVEREVIDFMATSQKLCRFLHLPLQSGSDSVLKAMRRPYTSEDFSAVAQYAEKKLGDFGFGTDVIIGFPGESEKDFRATEAMARDLPFNNLHVFSYSPRPGTPAASMPEQVSPCEKKKRAALMIELGRQKRNEFARSLVGKQLSLVAEKVQNGRAEGWTGEYVRARVKTASPRLKQIVRFTAEGAQNDLLLGVQSGE